MTKGAHDAVIKSMEDFNEWSMEVTDMERASILIVEDEDTQRSLLAGLLRKEGYVIGEAGTGERPWNYSEKMFLSLFSLIINFPIPMG